MIGIVVVSHSAGLARAARDLALEMTPGNQPVVACAGGLDDVTLGTDAARIAEAIGEADSPDGILVLMDLGSALLSTEMALEFIEPDVAQRVRMSPAPLVEGLVAAVVKASSGASLADVAAEAERGLLPKQLHLTGPASPQEAQPTAVAPEAPIEASGQNQQSNNETDSPAMTFSFVVPNRLGIHARPAAALVKLLAASGVDTALTNLTRVIGPANGTSLVEVAGLSALKGDELEVSASGPPAPVEALFTQLKQFVENNLGDDVSIETQPAVAGTQFHGPLTRLSLEPAAPAASSAGDRGDPADETARLEAALAAVRADLTEVVNRARRAVSDDAAEMVAAQLVFLDDTALVDPVKHRIQQGASAETAWNEQLSTMREKFAEMADEYLRAREQDVWSLQLRVLRQLLGAPSAPVESFSGVVVTEIIDAPTAVMLDVGKVVGVVTAHGGTLGHGAMILAHRGIPLAAELAHLFDGMAEGTEITATGR